MEAIYNQEFYDGQSGGSSRSARQVVPLVQRAFAPRRVLDVGCGVGTWLKEFAKAGVEEYLGIDGDYVDRSKLFIPIDAFRPIDLSKPFDVGRFDLVCSLEVAEHLPIASAEGFVSSLVDAAPVVLFSAAIPYQGGTDHINEQWQSYWAMKFAAHGYKAFDVIRPLLRGNRDVESWYRQNIVVYCDESRRPAGLEPVENLSDLDVVLPETYLSKVESDKTHSDYLASKIPSGRQSVRGLVNALTRRIQPRKK